MCEKFISRLTAIFVSLFPALWGIFSFFNNTADFSGTAKNAVAPLLSMQDTYHIPALMWRSISISWASDVGLALITLTETLAGICALVGVIIMLKNICGDYPRFAKGKAWAMLGAGFAVLVWGIGFMVVAGDWFMAWQAKENSLNTQLGAMIYATPCLFTIVVLIVQRLTEKE